MSFELTQKFLDDLEQRLHNGYVDQIVAELEELHAADVAEILDELDTEDSHLLLGKFEEEHRADILVELDEDSRKNILKELTSDAIATDIENLDSDDAADIVGELSEEKKKEVLTSMEDKEHAKDIASLLTHAEDTAGALMATELIVVNENWTVMRCVREMRRQAEEVDKVYAVYVVDDDNMLLGSLSLKELLTTSTKTPISSIYNSKIKYVNSSLPDDEVAQMMSKYDLFVVPVVDDMGRLLGRITIDDVVDVIKEEADKDYQLASGIVEDVESSDSVFQLTRARLPWLVIGLFGGMVVASIIGTNESSITAIPQLAFFMPLIAAMAGNVGVQSSAIVVQALANRTFTGTMVDKLMKELSVGLFNGIICAFILFAMSYILNYELNLAMTVSVSLLVVIVFASLFGTFIPLVLDKLNIDPAVATGPFITTANDIMGLSIYFYIGTLFFQI